MKEFFEALNRMGKPRRPDIIEKDYHLHRLLAAIASDGRLRRSLAFKGGTCLVKAYTGYFRFSEDIDFTWTDPSIWQERTKNQVAKACSSEIDSLVSDFKGLADALGLEFSGKKTDRECVHISSGGRMIDLHLGYSSEVLNAPASIKVEFSFVDRLLFPVRDVALKSFVESIDSRELAFLYPEHMRSYAGQVVIPCYDPREIFVEKCRAALTRRTFKLRDIIDLYYMERMHGFSVSAYRDQIDEKVRFIIDIYRRYKEHFTFPPLAKFDIQTSDEVRLLLMDPPDGLSAELERIHGELDALRRYIQNKASIAGG